MGDHRRWLKEAGQFSDGVTIDLGAQKNNNIDLLTNLNASQKHLLKPNNGCKGCRQVVPVSNNNILQLYSSIKLRTRCSMDVSF